MNTLDQISRLVRLIGGDGLRPLRGSLENLIASVSGRLLRALEPRIALEDSSFDAVHFLRLLQHLVLYESFQQIQVKAVRNVVRRLTKQFENRVESSKARFSEELESARAKVFSLERVSLPEFLETLERHRTNLTALVRQNRERTREKQALIAHKEERVRRLAGEIEQKEQLRAELQLQADFWLVFVALMREKQALCALALAELAKLEENFAERFSAEREFRTRPFDAATTQGSYSSSEDMIKRNKRANKR